MRATEGFVLGAITGAVVVWFWGQEIEDYLQEKTRGVRTKAAAGIRAVAEGAGQMFDRGGEALQRAEEFLKDTKGQVSDALRKEGDAIRPAPTQERG